MERVKFATSVNKVLLKEFKLLALNKDKKINELLEDAMQLFLKNEFRTLEIKNNI